MGQPRLEHAELEGQHVILRPLRAEDADEAFSLIHDRERILEWLVWKGPTSVAELRERFAAWRGTSTQGQGYRFAVLDRETDSFVGTMGLRCVDQMFQVELGYWLAERVWGRGFGSEAVHLADHLAFRHLCSTVVSAEVFVGNHASCRVLERNGFRRATSVHRAFDVPPTARGHERWIYTLTRGDYRRLHQDYRPRSERIVTE